MRIKIFWLLLPLFLFAQKLEAQISASDTSGCAPLVGVTFSGPAGATNINWDFDDGASSNLPSPSHSFGTAGIYTVVYTAIVSGNNYADSVTIYVHGKPSVYFTGTPPLNGCIPLSVSFHDSSFGGGGSAIATWEWAFGDGGVDVTNNPNPNYIYNLSGVFAVSLKVTDVFGCDSSFVRNNYILTSGLPVPLISSVPNPPSSCAPPLNVTFSGTGSVSNSPVGNSLTYSWSFGNGSTSNLENPPIVNYNAQGIYLVVLTVMDNNNCSDSANLTVSINNPVASFYAVNAVNDTVCSTVTFSNHSTPGSGFIYFYGDGLTGTDSVHNYLTPGTYNVTLQVQLGSCIDDTIITIVVEDVKANFTSAPTYGCSYPFITQFTSHSVNAYQYFWTFGDGSTSILQNPIDTIFLPDTNQYTIYDEIIYLTSLTVISPHGCLSSYYSVDTVFKPTALFKVNVAYGCAPLTVVFTDSSLSKEGITTRLWIFDDGTTHGGNDSITSHTYTTPGIYYSYLIITNAAGCIDTSVSIIIYVGGPPTPSFSVTPNPVCVHYPVQFNNLTPPADSAQTFHYQTDGGMSSHCFNDPNPTWSFNTNTGLQNITLYTSYNGCIGSTTISNAINVKGPLVHFYPVNDCNDHFTYTFNGTIKDAFNWTWDFGDAVILNTTTNSSPTHTYASTGDYIVKLIGYNNITGCVPDTEIVTIYVRDPAAAFTVDSFVCKNEIVLFDASPSQGVEAVCHEGYLFYWNDNTHPNNGDVAVASHSFANSGIYTVDLIVKDKNGCRDTVSQKIYVYEINADYRVDHTYGCLPLTVQFTDSSKADTTIVSWQWFFGDGTNSSLQNPPHTYTVPPSGGNYLVTFTATDILGCSDTRYFFITPSPK